MYSDNDPQEIKDFMRGLGFSTVEEGQVYDELLKKFTGKVVTIHNEGAKLVGKLHSATMIFGSHLNLTEVQESNCTPGVLSELHYYNPRNYKPELKDRNFGFVSAAFKEDPETTDLLVVPTDGCILECGEEFIQL